MQKIILWLVLGVMPLPVVAQSILVFGDSISAAYGMEVQSGWVTLLQQRLVADNSGYVINNHSISGETTAGGLARIDQALSQTKPAVVLLELGANDGLRGLSPQAMKANLTEMVKRSQAAGAKVLLLAMRIPPNYGERYVDTFFNIYPSLSAELHIPMVSFIEAVALDAELMQLDGLHPNAKAQPIIADKVGAALKPLLTR
jgi:acyl-CoA thioesterase-1